MEMISLRSNFLCIFPKRTVSHESTLSPNIWPCSGSRWWCVHVFNQAKGVSLYVIFEKDNTSWSYKLIMVYINNELHVPSPVRV